MRLHKKSYAKDNGEGRVPKDKFGSYPKRYSKEQDFSSLGRISADVVRDKDLIGKSLLEEVASEIAVFLEDELSISETVDLEYLSKCHFSKDWMGKFLYAFIRSGSISQACKCIGVSSQQLLYGNETCMMDPVGQV